MDWSQVELRQPRLAELGRQRLLAPGVVLVVTIRLDGTPRLSPVEPYLMDGQLLLSMLWRSRKAQDLLRDPRVTAEEMMALACSPMPRSAEVNPSLRCSWFEASHPLP